MPAGSPRGLPPRLDEVQAAFARLQAAGVHFDGPPEPRPWGTVETVFRDPDGNEFVLQG